MTKTKTREEEITSLEGRLSYEEDKVERIKKEMRNEAPVTMDSCELILHFRDEDERRFFVGRMDSWNDKEYWYEEELEEDWFSYEKGFSFTIPERTNLKNMSQHSLFEVIMNRPEHQVKACKYQLELLKSQEEN